MKKKKKNKQGVSLEAIAAAEQAYISYKFII